jgi:hypothetical protein
MDISAVLTLEETSYLNKFGDGNPSEGFYWFIFLAAGILFP